eukprot:gnl/TRDRNA2_/TRDRNA2_63168_c0_seq1.p1 gnl/TRDRNA2_/TRDRNA2_63168_c0~~gnl/TRDRNA2_/TRDRNA2_63168_c0_seq1.p1  ORF type:complete len:570 (-),score=99.56 gnl/TRDRNA2_/TRDRNA2_63168_c0_seq1:107-1816(-)
MRFANVFTKLHVLNLVEYSKVLMLDIDLLVRENIDHLFELPAPAAMVRGPEVGYVHGERIKGQYFFAGSWHEDYSWGQSSGINAGVMLLRPDAERFKQCLREVADKQHPEHIAGRGPEQDYLSRFFAGEWRHLSVAYNFQLHQMYYALSPAYVSIADRVEFLLNPERIKVIHYSSEPKPWARHLDTAYQGWSDKEWHDEVKYSFRGYKAWVLKEPTALSQECEHDSIAVGPGNKFYRIDWKRPFRHSTNSSSEGWQSSGDIGDGQAEKTEDGGLHDEEGQPVGAMRPEDGGLCKEESQLPMGEVLPDDGGLYSEEGQPLGEVLEESESAVKGADEIVRMSQELWDKTYGELKVELGEPNLAAAVAGAAADVGCSGDQGDWQDGKAETTSSGAAGAAAAAWSRHGGWWVEGPVSGRAVACCGVLPRSRATLMIGGGLLLDADCNGIHVAACEPGVASSSCPAPQTFAIDADGHGELLAAQATRWAEAVPQGAAVLLAIVLGSGAEAAAGLITATLSALAGAGIGCPVQAPPEGCTVAAAVGRKGNSSWYATHASADVALASCIIAPQLAE